MVHLRFGDNFSCRIGKIINIYYWYRILLKLCIHTENLVTFKNKIYF